MRKFFFFSFVCLALVAGFSAPSLAGKSEKIALVVNDGVITRSDVEDRLRMIMISSGLPNNAQTRNQILPQIVRTLVDEEIRMQEAEKLGVKVSEQDIANGFATVAQQNNMKPEQFKQVVRKSGVNISTLTEQIKAQVAWTKVVQAKLRPRIQISDNDVDARMERLNASIGKSEYLLSEIFLPVEDTKDHAKVRQLARRLSNDIRAGKVPFFKVAQQFSKAAGASTGGDLGWVQEGQLPDEVDETLPSLRRGQLSDPIQTVSGYHIILMREIRQIQAENIPDRERVRQAIGMERLERMQRRHLMDLKSVAYIENRLVQPSS